MSSSTYVLIAGMSGFFVGMILFVVQWYDKAIFCMSISGALVGYSIPKKISSRIICAIFGFLLGGALVFFIAQAFGIDIITLLELT